MVVAHGETTVTVTADGGLTGVLIADDGTVTVPAGTPADSYTVTYELCLESDPSVCDTADVTIVVAAATLVAVDDTPAPIDGALGGSTASVLGNDTLNGAVVDPADVTLTPGTAPVPATGWGSLILGTPGMPSD